MCRIELRCHSKLVNGGGAIPTAHNICFWREDPWGRTSGQSCADANVTDRPPTIALTLAEETSGIDIPTGRDTGACIISCESRTASLTATVSDPDGDPVTVTWSNNTPTSCTLTTPASCSGTCSRTSTITCGNLNTNRTGTWTATVADSAGFSSPLNDSKSATIRANCDCNACICP